MTDLFGTQPDRTVGIENAKFLAALATMPRARIMQTSPADFPKACPKIVAANVRFHGGMR